MSVQYTSHKNEVLQALQSQIKIGLEVIGGKAESYAKELCPVDTGRLRNSITHEQESESTEVIGSNVEYAPYVELGHNTTKGNHISAKPFLRPAAEGHGAEYKAVMQQALNS